MRTFWWDIDSCPSTFTYKSYSHSNDKNIRRSWDCGIVECPLRISTFVSTTYPKWKFKILRLHTMTRYMDYNQNARISRVFQTSYRTDFHLQIYVFSALMPKPSGCPKPSECSNPSECPNSTQILRTILSRFSDEYLPRVQIWIEHSIASRFGSQSSLVLWSRVDRLDKLFELRVLCVVEASGWICIWSDNRYLLYSSTNSSLFDSTIREFVRTEETQGSDKDFVILTLNLLFYIILYLYK